MSQFYRGIAWFFSNWIRFVLVLSLALCLALTACKSKPEYVPIQPRVTPEQAVRAYRLHLMNVLINQHIMVITLGETKRIIIPSDVIFSPYSANLYANQCSKLDTIAKLIASYTTEMVRVDAYEDDFFPIPVSDALSAKQAQTVADYLRNQHMDTRFILKHGFGQQNPVAGNQTADGRCYNRRIEVTFRVYPPEPIY